MMMDENEITFLIRGAIFRIYNIPGAGLFENLYKHVLKCELVKVGLSVRSENSIASLLL